LIAAHPHVHCNQINAHRRHIAFNLRIMPHQHMLRAFKPGKTLFVASADFLRTNNRQPVGPHYFSVISEYPPEMLDIEMLFIDCVKIVIHHTDYLKLINQCAYLFFIHRVSVPRLAGESHEINYGNCDPFFYRVPREIFDSP